MSHPAAVFERARELHRQGELDQAIELYRKCVSATPRVGAPWYYLGLALQAKLRLSGAAEALSKAATLIPGDVGVRSIHSRVEQSLGRFDRALRTWMELITHVPSSVEARLGYAQTLFELRRPEPALEAVQQAENELGEDHRLVRARLRFAERLGRQHDALDACHWLLERFPGDPEASLYAARLPIASVAGDVDAERCRLLEAASAGDPRGYVAGMAQLDLAKLKEAQGDYDVAFAHVAEGKRRLLALEPPENQSHAMYLSHVRSFADRVSDQWGPRWDVLPDTGLTSATDTPAFIVGFPRTGTTLLEQILNAHPALHATDELPVLQPVRDVLHENFVGKLAYPAWVGLLSPRQVEHGRATYWNRARWYCGDALTGKRLVDKQPLNLAHLPLARRLFPRAPVIVVIRDPRDTCLSCFFQPMSGVASFYDLEQTAELYVALMDLWAYYRRVLNLNWLELRYEDLVADPEGKAREVLSFLGVDWDPEVLKFYEPKHRRLITTPSYQDVTRPVYSSAKARWKKYERHMKGAFRILEGKVRELGYEASPSLRKVHNP